MSAALPTGWRCEQLGLIGAVQFTGPAGHSLLWCDGAWTQGPRGIPAPGVPVAHSVKEARRAGAAFLAALDAS